MRQVAEFIARAAGWLSCRLGRGGGTTVPGAVLLKLRRQAAAELAEELSEGSIVISATNGKTTTARILRLSIDLAGRRTVANTTGSNLLRGVTTALIANRGKADIGVFEVDEAALPTTIKQLQPHTVVLMNLFRDQLDRYGELERLLDTWVNLVDELPSETKLILNSDDPAVAFLGKGRPNVTYFGIDAPEVDRSELSHASDSVRCPQCDAALEYSLITIGHMGHWQCTSCQLERPTPTIAATTIAHNSLDGFDLELSIPLGVIHSHIKLPGLHNAYNATAAAAAAFDLSVPAKTIGTALSQTRPAFGRSERISFAGRELLLLLAKNPTGANENIRVTLLEQNELHVIVLLNDRSADGQDVSWIWDVDYELLLSRATSLTLSGTRAHDLALRFVYGGFELDRIHIETDAYIAIEYAMTKAPPGSTVYALPTYTAMLDLRKELVERGVTHPFWEDK